MSTTRILSRGVATLLALAPMTLRAGTQTITAAGNPSDAEWGLATNWSGTNGAVLPGAGDLAVISYDFGNTDGVDIRGSDFTGPPANFTEVAGLSFIGGGIGEADLANSDAVSNMTLALNGAGGTVPLIQTGDYLVQIMGVGSNAKTLTLQLKGSGEVNVGNGGLTISSQITQTGGTFGFNQTGAGTLTLSGTTANTYTGLTTVSGGTLTAAKTAGINAIGGNLDIEAGGTFVLGASDQIANGASITINGGTFNDPTNLNPAQGGPIDTVTNVTINSGAFGSNRNLTGFTATGLFKVTGTGLAVAQRGGVINAGSAEISSGGVVDLDGGSTTANNESRLKITSGTLTLSDGTVNFNTGNVTGTSVGSILSLAGNVTQTGTTNFVRVDTSTNRPASVSLGTAVRTFNIGGTLNIGAVGATVTMSNGAGGGLIKTGLGTLEMSGTSSLMTGPITVSAGTLALNGSVGTGTAIAVQGGSTLAFNGTQAAGRTVALTGASTLSGLGSIAGVVTVFGGSNVQTGDATGVGNLTVNGLTLGQNATDTATLNLTTAAELIVQTAGALAPAGTGKTTINVLGAPLGAGTFTLIDYTTSIGGVGFPGFVLGSVPLQPRRAAVLTKNDANTSIQLTVSVDVPVWSGALSTEWSTATLPAPKNWVLQSNPSLATDFLAADSAIFNDVATATAVDISVADVSPTAVTFSNAAKDYTLTGSHAIAGNTGLTKSGAGMVTIGNTNTFTGAANLNGGTVSVAAVADSNAASPLGAGTTIAFNGGTLEFTGASGSTNRAITLGASGATVKTTGASLTLAGVLSSSGPLTKTGAGTLTLGGTSPNTNTGLTTVSAGTLIAGKPAGTNAIGGSLTIQGGAFMYSGNNVSNQIADTATITVNGGTFGDPVSAAPTNPGATDTVANVTVSGGTFNSGRNATLTPFTITSLLNVTSGAALAQRGGGISAGTVHFSGGSLNLDGGSTTPGQESKLIVGAGGLTLTGSTINLNSGESGVTAASVGSILTLNGDVTSTGTSSFARMNPGLSSAVMNLGGAVRTFNVTGTLGVGNAAAPITILNGGINKTGAGTLTVSATQNSTTLTTTGGALQLSTSVALAALNPGAGTVTTLTSHAGGPANVKTIDTQALTFSGNGMLDLTNNAMVVRGATLVAVNAKLKSGFNGFSWNGSGINSSTAANDPNGLTAIGVIDNADFVLSSFAGVSGLTGAEILTKYTYYGDSDLSGTVDFNDFVDFSAGFNGEVPAEWAFGDFDYNGVVDFNDFVLFSAGFTDQGAALRSEESSAILSQELGQMGAEIGLGSGSSADAMAAAAAGQAVVPEPGSIGLLAVGALGLLARRRR